MKHDLNTRQELAIFQYLREEANYRPVGQDDWLPDYQHINRLHLLEQVEAFVLDVLKSNRPAFTLRRRKVGRSGLQIEKDEIVEHRLAQYFRKVIDWYGAYSPSYRYSVHAQLFFSSCAASPLHREDFLSPGQQTSIPSVKAYELYNQLIHEIRIRARSPAFKRVLAHQHGAVARLCEGAEQYVRCLFNKHAKLLVIRIDLSYAQHRSYPVTLERCKRDFNRFLNSLRHNQELDKDRVGYIWSLEYAPAKGYHYHCLYFFNGSNRQSDFYWGKRVGEYWEQIVENGQYWNVNTQEKKAEYERQGLLGIGKIHRSDDSKIANLLHIVSYMAKTEQYLLYRELQGCRCFGKGRCAGNSQPVDDGPLLIFFP